MHEFGRWITSHKWDEVLNASNTQKKSDAFYATVLKAMDKYLPTKSVRIHTTDKPWITAKIKELIKRRQKAFVEKKMIMWRLLKNKVIRAIEQAKKSYYNNSIQDLKSSDPSGWHRGIQMIVNKHQPRPIISVPGVPLDDEKAIAETINNTFAEVSQSRPLLIGHSCQPFCHPNTLLKSKCGICTTSLNNLTLRKLLAQMDSQVN
jgi:hypothetical protein